MPTFNESQVTRKAKGSSEGGQFAHFHHGENPAALVSDDYLDEEPQDIPSKDLPVLQGKFWYLPRWEVTKDHPEWVFAYAREVVRRNMTTEEISQNPSDIDDLTQEALVEFYQAVETTHPNSPGNYLATLASRTVIHSRSDVKRAEERVARTIYMDRVAELTQLEGRELTSAEKEEVGFDIRENWDEYRQGKSTSSRPPKKEFWKVLASEVSLDQQVSGPNGEGSTTLADYFMSANLDGSRSDRVRREHEIAQGTAAASRQAGKMYLHAKAQLEEREGHPLSRQQEELLAQHVIKKWPAQSAYQPALDFHRRTSSFYEPPVESWAQRSLELTTDPSQGGKRMARVVAYNAISELGGRPQVQLGCLTRGNCVTVRRTVKERGVMQTLRDWEEGDYNPSTRAFWSVWPGISEQEKAEVVTLFQASPHLANSLWDSAVSLADPRNADRVIGRSSSKVAA